MQIIELDNKCEKIIDEVMKIHTKKLGENYLGKDYFLMAAKNNELLVLVQNEEVVGYLTYRICSEKEFYKKENLKLAGTDKIVLILDVMAVKYEKQGIGSQLIDYCIQKNSNKVSKIMSPVWKSKNGTNAKNVLEKFGLVKTHEFENFWYEESLKHENYCPVCNYPCVCTLELFCKNLN